MKTLIKFLNFDKLISLIFNNCFFGHEWRYNREDVPVTNIDETHKTKIKANIRVCEKCYLKEVQGMQWRKYNKYSKEELREINLNRILGK